MIANYNEIVEVDLEKIARCQRDFKIQQWTFRDINNAVNISHPQP